MKRLAALALALAAPLAAADEAVTPANALQESCYFGSSSASLTSDCYAILRAVAAALQAEPALRIEVQGHADTSASASINVPLAQERADAAREFLTHLGVAPERLVAKGYGAYEPLNDNATLERRSWNRRVVFKQADTP
jgi:outer membrane protein OmpA-like peptidoglycan-associated protein